MLRVGIGKPHLSQATGRWGEDLPRPVFYVNDFGWVGLEKWKSINYYQSKIRNPLIELVPDLLEKTLRDKLGLSKQGAVWEFNALARNMEDQIRFVAMFEVNDECLKLVRWTWWDANVKYWALRAVAWIRTKLGV